MKTRFTESTTTWVKKLFKISWLFRFANGIIEPLWNRNFISRVEVTAAESIGVEERGGYYDHYGALRDMVQNHLLQVVGTI
jgi:glucose-6-phosphate 1-dehydrogenase